MASTALLVVHPSDSTWTSIEGYLSVLSERHLLNDFLVMYSNENAEIGDVPIRLVDESGIRDKHLYDHLATVGHTDSLIISGVQSSNLSDEQQLEISNSIDWLNAGLVRLASSVSRLNVRVSIPSDLERVAGPPFFSAASDANVVVLPRDQARNQAVARPLTRDAGGTFAKHASVELASILALWKFMDNSILEKVERQHQGIGGYEVVFVSSRVKGVLAPPLPIGSLVDESGELPVPPSFTALERPQLVSLRYAQAIYPDSLRFEIPVRPKFGVDRNLWNLVKEYSKEIGSVVYRLPSTFWRGLQSDVNEIAGTAMTEAMGGQDGWINVVWETMNSGDAVHLLSQEEVHKIISEIELRAERPVLTVIPTSTWNQMVDQVFGIADGAEVADSIRRQLTQATFLVLDKNSLAPKSDDLAETATLALGHDKTWNPIYVPSAEEIDPVVESDEENDKAIEEGLINEETAESTKSVDDLVEESTDLDETFDDVELEKKSRQVSPPQRLTSLDVVGGITQELVSNYEIASRSVVQTLNEIQNLPSEFTGKDLGKISQSVLIGISSAIGLLFIALGSMTPAKKVMSFEWLSRTTAAQIWLMFSTAFIVIAIVTGITGGKRTWQGRAILAALVSSGIVALEYIFFDSVYEWINRFEWLASSNIPAIAVFLVTLAICGFSVVRNLASDEPIRKKIGKFVLLFSWVYAVIGITSSLASKTSVLQRAPESIKSRFFISSNFVGWTVLFTGLIIVAVLRVREKNRVGKAGHDFRNACLELEMCVDARSRLDIATAQWLGIASVAARTIWFPLGRRVSELRASDEELTGDESILKFDLANIRLLDSGTSHLLSRLRQRFVRTGWLRRQLQVAIDSYTELEAFDSGNQREHHYPFACSSTPTVDEVLDGYARGDRWGFAHRYFAGEYDEQLLNSAVEQRVPDMYRDLVKDARMHEVTESQNEYATSFDFLLDVVPTVVKQIPPGLSTSLFTANQRESSMRSFTWWPEGEIGTISADAVEELLPIETIRAKSYKDSEMILAATVDLSHSFHSADLTGATRDEKINPENGHGW
jgi:hypothetical protein